MYKELETKLKKYNQLHLLDFWNEISEKERKQLASQIKEIDWEQLNSLIKSHVIQNVKKQQFNKIKPPDYFPAFPKNEEDKSLYKKAERRGKELLQKSKVAAVTVAGGQGTRLGFDGPKGTFPITPVKNKSLFQYFAESLVRASEKFASDIKWFIMTSKLNDAVTKKFFEENNYFGLKKEQVYFFTQGTMPSISEEGKVLMASKSSLALAPDGHGGTLLALRKSGALDKMYKEGIEYISYFQVDNPLVSVVNPLFIGLHDIKKSDMSSIMLKKSTPEEKIGNFCLIDDKLNVIEYSDIPQELSQERDEKGELVFSAGSPAIHMININFISDLTKENRSSLPWHKAKKGVAYINKQGNVVNPEYPNAIKLETFIFDALPFAKNPILLEAKREEEFAPIKNKTGPDSVETSRKMLIDRDSRCLEDYGDLKLPRKNDGTLDCIVEISPLSFLDKEDVEGNRRKFDPPERGKRSYYE